MRASKCEVSSMRTTWTCPASRSPSSRIAARTGFLSTMTILREWSMGRRAIFKHRAKPPASEVHDPHQRVESRHRRLPKAAASPTGGILCRALTNGAADCALIRLPAAIGLSTGVLSPEGESLPYGASSSAITRHQQAWHRMAFHADLHVHSKYSRATSRDFDLEHLAAWACRKGIGVVATGDFTHPAWCAELKQKLVAAEPGLFRLRSDIEQAVAQTLPAACRTPV